MHHFNLLELYMNTFTYNSLIVLFVIILIIEEENVVSNDCDTISLTDALKSVPIVADVCSAEPLSICFNLIKFAISYKYYAPNVKVIGSAYTYGAFDSFTWVATAKFTLNIQYVGLGNI